MEGWSVHGHRGVVGMLFRYLVRLELGRKGVVDMEVAWVSPAAMAARCSGGWGAGGR
jgi:hypothetical protein